jgi:hypothetical protein
MILARLAQALARARTLAQAASAASVATMGRLAVESARF